MTLWSSVDCEEVFGSRKEGYSVKGGPNGNVTLEVDYANRKALVNDLLENGRWPFTEAGKAPLKVQDIDLTFLETEYDTDEQVIVYKKAQLDVSYSYDRGGSSESGGGGGGSGTGRQLYTESLEPIVEVISVMDYQFYWSIREEPSGITTFYPLDETNIPTYRTYSINIERTYFNWIMVPISFLQLVGFVNDAELVLMGVTFPIETLLFIPRNINRSVSSEGTEGYSVQVGFSYNYGGWNKFPVPEEATGKVEKKTLFLKGKNLAYTHVDPTEFVPYPLGDFSDWVF